MRAYIFEKGTETTKCSVEKLEYNGQFMGESSVIVSVKSNKHIDFNIDDYVVFRGENFYLANIPTEKKTGDRNTNGDVFQYDNMKFMSVQYELNNADFNDFVGDSQADVSFTAQPNFSFVADTVADLAQRIQVNMDRYYTGDKKWTIKVDSNYTTSDDNLNKLITISNITCWGALALFKSLYDTNFIVRGRTVTIGGSGSVKDITFKVGAYEGLWDMTRNSQSDQDIVTKLTTYGNTTNIHPRYYSLIGVTVSAKIISATLYNKTRNGYSQLVVLFDLNYHTELMVNLNVSINSVTIPFVYGKYGDIYGYGIPTSYKDYSSVSNTIYNSLAVNGDNVPQANKSVVIVSGARKDNISDISHLSFDVNRKLPNNMNIANLMLPGFPTGTLADWVEANKTKYSWLQEYVNQGYTFSTERFYPYIYSKNKNVLGIRPHTEYFTSDDETHKDIYPSLKYFQDDKNKALDCTDKDGKSITWSGILSEGSEVPYFYILVNDLGFNLDDVEMPSTKPKIHFNSGYCGGRDFTAESWEENGNGWKLKCKYVKDDSIGKYFPYADALIKSGDVFVITDIYMPDTYIEQASVELLKWSFKWLVKNDYTVYSYSLNPDINFIKRHDDKTTDKTNTFYKSIKEGDILLVEDTDMGVKGSITIDQIKITIGDGLLPKYDITLRDTKTVGTLQKVQQQIDALTVGGSGSGYNSSQISEIAYAATKNKFLSKEHDDKTDYSLGVGGDLNVDGNQVVKGKSILQKGAKFGAIYREGLNGEGANIDGEGNAEFQTVNVRGSLTASELDFNRIKIIEGQEMSSRAEGTILSVRKTRDGDKIIKLKLAGDEFGAFKVGDKFRGMYNTLGIAGTTQYKPMDAEGNSGDKLVDGAIDKNGFPMRKGFYTAYAMVTSILTDNVWDEAEQCRTFEFTYQNMDGWVDANGVEIEPCAMMKIAQYSNGEDETRQGFMLRNTIGKVYDILYYHCTTWQIHSWNVLKAEGQIKGMEFFVGGNTKKTVTLDNDGTYEAGSHYFNGELKTINPTTYDDITKKLKSYNVVASKRSDTITVDAVGNVIGGYWTSVEGDDGTVRKAYRLNTAVMAYKADGTPLLLNGTQGDETDLVTEGQYAVYATGSDCTPIVKDGVVYIVAINNIHDGDATSHDSIDYDTMRAMKECVVTITVDCEGLGVKTIDYRVVINHKDTAYISAHLDNEVASISYNTKSSSYLGLPVSTNAHMYHNNDELTLTGMTCSKSVNGLSISVNPSTGLLTISQATASVNDVIDNNVIIPIDVTTMYSGASYEQTLYFKLSKSADNNTYELKPSTSAINAVKTSDNTYVYSDGGKVSCGVKCTSTDDGIYELTSSVLSARGFKIQYSFNEDNNGDSVDDRTYSDYALGASLDVTAHNEVSFRMVRLSDSLVIYKQTIPVVRGGLNGVDGIDFEYVFCRQTSKPAAPDYTGANKITDSYTDDKGVVWYDHPQGIDDLHPQEWMSFRTSVNADNGSKTFSGQSFGHVQSWEADGDGLEYIYAINNSATTPPTLSQPSNYNTDATCQGDDYIPSGWADDSLVANISEQNPYCWRAMRKKSSGGLWGWFSTPKIAAYKAKDAAVLWLSDYLVTLPTDLNKLMLTAFAEAINLELRVPSVDGTMYETCSITNVSISRSDSSSNVSCSVTGSVINIAAAKDASVDSESITIIAIGTHNNATYQSQTVIKIVPNMTGSDGDGFQNIFAISQENVSLSFTAEQKQSASIPSGWTDDMQAATQEYPNLWQSVRTIADNGTKGVVYGNWSDPKKVSHYGADAFSMELSNDTSLFHVDYYGNNIDTSVETTKIYIKKSGIDDTDNWNLTAPTSCSINNNKDLVVPVSLLTSDSNTFTVTGTRTISGILRTLTKNYTVKKHYDGRDSDEEESIYQIVDDGNNIVDDASSWEASQQTDTEILTNHQNWTDEPRQMNKGQITYRSTRYKEDGTLNSVKGKYWGKFSTPIIVFRNPVDPYNSITVRMYKRSSTTPTTLPTGITYTFSTKSVTGTLNGWSLTEPSGSDNLYITMATAYSNTDTDAISDSEWISPIKMTGVDGIGITGTEVTYQANDSGINIPSGTWYASVDNTGIKQGMYLWTRIMYTYSNGSSKTTYSVGYMGTDGVAFNCSPSAFIIETYNNGVPKSAGSQNFTFTATKKSTDLYAGFVGAEESEVTNTTLESSARGILNLSWNNTEVLVSHVITATVTFKDSDNNSYSHNFIIPITLAKQGDAGAPSVSYELATNVNAFTFSLGDNAINWGSTYTDNPTITPSNVVASEDSITCVAKKRIGQQAATAFTSGALYFVTSANTAKDAETLYSSINSGNGLINLNTNYYQCTFIEFRLYDSTSKTTLLASKAVNINYDTTAYFAKLKEAIVGSIGDGKGGIATFFEMAKDGLHFGGNTINNTAITNIFTMMESAIADKALELIAKNTSYNITDDKADMSDWINKGSTISSSDGYNNGYGAYIPTNSIIINESDMSDWSNTDGARGSSDGHNYADIATSNYIVKNLSLEANSLYIFEFYAKGAGVNSQLVSYIYPNVNERIVYVNVDTATYVQDRSDTYCRWSLTTDWKKYVLVFKTMENMTETEQKSISFSIVSGKTACYVSNVKLSLSSYIVKNLYMKADSLYTFEFYAKGTDGNSQLVSYIYPNVNARIVSVNVDTSIYEQDGSDTHCTWSLTTDWKKYVLVFKTMENMTETEQKSISFSIVSGKTACYVSNVKLSLSSYLVGALSGTTDISGGLILSNLMGVRDATGKVQAYMNGLLTKAYAIALGITNFGTKNEDSITHFAFDGSAKVGHLQVMSDGTTYLIDDNKIQRVLLSPNYIDSLANLTSNVGMTSSYTASKKSISANTYGGFSESVNLCSVNVLYSGSTISYTSITLDATITKGFNLTVVVELVANDSSYTNQIASLSLDPILDTINSKTLIVEAGIIYGIPAGSYYFRLRAEMYTRNNIEFTASSDEFNGVVSKTNSDQIQGIFARDGFASVYSPKQYTYVKQGLLYAGGWPQISGILLTGSISPTGENSNMIGPLTNYTELTSSRIMDSDPHRYIVNFRTALKSNVYNIIATAIYNGTTLDGRKPKVYAKTTTSFVVYMNDGGDGIATDTGFSFILVGDLMTLTKE